MAKWTNFQTLKNNFRGKIRYQNWFKNWGIYLKVETQDKARPLKYLWTFYSVHFCKKKKKKSKYLILHLLKQTIFMAKQQCSQITYDIKRQLVKPDSADDNISPVPQWNEKSTHCIFHIIKFVKCKAFSFVKRWCLSVDVMSFSPLYSITQRLPVSIFSFLLFSFSSKTSLRLICYVNLHFP